MLLTTLLLPASAAARPDLATLPPAARIAQIESLLAPRPLAADAPLPRPGSSDATARHLEAFHLWKSLPPEQQPPLRHYFYPSGTTRCLTSDRLPIRSCYTTAGQRTRAQFMLAEVERAWDFQVTELGFWPPRRTNGEGPEEGIDFALGNARSQGAAGYTVPGDWDPTTPQWDCLSTIVIEETYEPGPDMARTIQHEFSHALQMAMDCLETASSMEATSTWLPTVLQEELDTYYLYAASNYQAHPEWPLNADPETDAFYKYGSSLFLRFVHEYLGEGDPRTVARLWEATVQDEQINEPDLLDAILELAATRGLDFAGLLQAFGEWRFFLGAHDDGAHFTHGAEMLGAEPRIRGQLVLADLDLLPLQMAVTLPPLAYSYATVELDRDRLPPGGSLVLGGRRDSLERWSLTLWLLREGQPFEARTTLFDHRNAKPIVVHTAELAGVTGLVLQIVNVHSAIDWDDWSMDRHFQLQADYRLAPELRQVEPDRLLPGDERTITLQGANFAAGAQVELLGEEVWLNGCARQDQHRITCQVRVLPTAAVGPRGLRVVNDPAQPDLSATLAEALTVAPPDPPRALSIFPAQARAGTDQLVQLRGVGLGATLEVRLSCPGVEVPEVHLASPELAYLRVRIPEGAAATPCDLTLRDGYGRSTTLPAGFAIQAPDLPSPAPPADSATSDGCNLARPAASRPALLGLLLPLLLLLRSSSRAPAGR